MGYENSSKQLDKWDYIIATSSGVLTAAIDVILGKDLNLTASRKWGVDETEKFVIAVSKRQGCKSDDIVEAIKYLEDNFKIPADKATNAFGGGLQHHLRDFSHHPTPLGLVFSIITQFTGVCYGTDVTGKIIPVTVPENTLARGTTLNKLYAGTVTWIFHLISDMAGSSSSVKSGSKGTGIPGPLMSMLKELSSVPGIKDIAGTNESGNSNFSVYCSKLFNGTLLGEHDENGKIIKNKQLQFDLRTEIGITHEAITNRQYLPVLLNELIVRGFYSVRRFLSEIKEKPVSSLEDLKQIDPKKFLPWKSKQLTHMLMISSATFSVIDISSAGIKAAIRNPGNKSAFAVDFIQGINLFGTGRLVLAVGGEAGLGLDKLHAEYLKLANAQLAHIGYTYNQAKDVSVILASSVGTIAKLSNPISYVSAAVLVYQELDSSIRDYRLARKNRIEIQKKCQESVQILLENREQMNAAVSEYMESNLSVFADAFEDMDTAIQTNDVNLYIGGNKKIQEKLGRADAFSSASEFDDLMASDDDFKL